MRARPYLFYDVAISICSTCYRKIEGKIILQDDRVLMRRRCPEHGWQTVLLADDVEYYRRCREQWVKPGELPERFSTPIRWGCPYDCGLCPDHEQHSCLSVVEITDACNLRCPVCYASSGPERQRYRSLEQVTAMLDAVVAAEGAPDVVQISGGEPTLHPDFFEILAAARERPIRHLMINTNGLRLAREPGFAERLAARGWGPPGPGLEVYLQFDSFEEGALRTLRGADLRQSREQALAACARAGLDVTLVVPVQRGVNDHELGRIIDYGLAQPCVRGVTLQPVQAAGRHDGFDPAWDRLTLTEVRRRVLNQTDVFSADDIVPVPCHPDAIAMAYAVQMGEQLVPLTGLVPREVLLAGPRNTIAFEKEAPVREHLVRLFSTGHSPESGSASLRELLCCLPRVDAPGDWSYRQVFRLIILQFMDAWSFDVRSVKKSCVHIVHPDGRMIPFDTYNLFYRDDLEETRLGPLRRSIQPAADVETSAAE